MSSAMIKANWPESKVTGHQSNSGAEVWELNCDFVRHDKTERYFKKARHVFLHITSTAPSLFFVSLHL
jgi:hypothetical protein